MNILIVDDNDTMIYLLKTVLNREGYNHIYTANSSHAAAKLLGVGGISTASAEIDLILLDVLMPGMDGIQVCSMIKAHEKYQDVPIIMVTGITEESTLKNAFEAGAIDYITKPYKPIELIARVRSALKLKNKIDQRKTRESQLLHVTRLLEEAVFSLQVSNLTDGLTGVKNRRGFDEQLIKEYQRTMKENYAHNKSTPLSLILLDVDQFKLFNDCYGHVEGDHCLKNIALALQQENRRPNDYLARYGGEEFVILLPGTSLAEAITVAERLRIAVENLNIPHSGSEVSPFITISLGVCSIVPTDETNTEAFITLTDNALYEAKSAGRNRVEIYSR